MKSLKVCFVGIGSIARRHIHNLRTVCGRRGIELRVDAFRRRTGADRKDDELQFEKVYTSYGEIDSEYDAVFITNPTEYHIETLNSMMKYGRNFFIEKPVSSVHQIEEAEIRKYL